MAEALPAGRRQLRILVAAPGQVRAYLTADLLRRAAETARLLPTVTELLPTGAMTGALHAACGDLNIHPPRDALAAPIDPVVGIPLFDVGIRPVDMAMSSDGTELARLWIDVGRDAQEGDFGAEPLAVRLALMRHGYAEAVPRPGELGGGEAAMLARWRALVAGWARSPSGAMSREYDEAVTQAFANDLDTPTALRALTKLIDDPEVPDGVKFETFAAADRLLGLDLARDIGKYLPTVEVPEGAGPSAPGSGPAR
jgi:hypothetical protein